jgi:predicted nucleic acid-binding Zn ribbon protein
MKRQRRYGTSSLQRASQAASSMLQEFDLEQLLRPHMAKIYWPQVVGPAIAAATQVVSVKNGLLMVRAKDSVWGNELGFHVDDIVRDLNKILKGPYIKKIRIDSSGLLPSSKLPAVPDVPEPTAEELAAIPLSEEALGRIELSMRNITHEDLRDRVRRSLLRKARIEEWKRRHDWKPCSRCKVLVPPPRLMCSSCRLGIL